MTLAVGTRRSYEWLANEADVPIEDSRMAPDELGEAISTAVGGVYASHHGAHMTRAAEMEELIDDAYGTICEAADSPAEAQAMIKFVRWYATYRLSKLLTPPIEE